MTKEQWYEHIEQITGRKGPHHGGDAVAWNAKVQEHLHAAFMPGSSQTCLPCRDYFETKREAKQGPARQISRTLVAVAIILALAANATAGVNALLTLSTGAYGGMGFKSPTLAFGGGVQIENDLFWIRSLSTYQPTSKIAYKTFSIDSDNRALVKLHKIRMGGGVHYAICNFTELHTIKSVLHPFIEAGYGPVIFRQSFSGSDSWNHTTERDAIIDLAFGRFMTELKAGMVSYDIASGNPRAGRRTAFVVEYGLIVKL